jgi:hypothetical protein
LLGTLLLTAAAARSAVAPVEPVFVPDPPDPPGNLALSGQTWTAEAPAFVLRLQMIDDAQRLAYIEHVTGVSVDPFLSPPEEQDRFLSFVIEIQNRGQAPLSFNPRGAWIGTDTRNDASTPIGLTDLAFGYRMTDREMPPAYNRVAAALLEHPRFVNPGASVSGLLIYRSVAPRTKRMRLDFALTLPSGEEVRFTAPYQRKPKEDKRDEQD